MTTVDVDCHFDLRVGPEDHPFRELADRLPSLAEFVASATVGDLLRATPPRSRIDPELTMHSLPDANQSAAEQAVAPGRTEPRYPVATLEERGRWMAAVGIDHAFMNPGGGGFVVDFLGDERHRGIRLYNDFMADALQGGTDRMSPVSIVDWEDLDRAVTELERMRARGSRAFWMKAAPLGGVGLGSPALDRLWSAATSLGMAAVIHVGNTPVNFGGGWANMGWELDGSPNFGGFVRYANALRHQPAEMALASMVFGGVFGRHPNLTVLLEELLIGWLPFFVRRCDSLGDAGWPFDLSPGEMVRRNVRSTPLPGLGDTGIADVLLQLPEMFVFSSDYPHGEGSATPIELYAPILDGVDAQIRASFFGDNIADCFRRMGDPLPLVGRTDIV
ncbi:MAG: amidohydrolase family protein [Acidimicrobiales bacterium]